MDARLVALISLLVTALVYVRRKAARGPAPPGPPQIPIIGNILPEEAPWEGIRQFSLKYGPVITLRVLSTNIYAVNTVAAAAELCEVRSSVYSQRNPMKMLDLCGFNEGILFETNVTHLRQARKLVASGIGPRELDKYRPQLRAHIVTFLGHMLHAPEQFLDHIRDLPIGIMLEIVYGYKTTEKKDPFILGADILVHNYAKASAISDFLVNWLPFMAYIPSWVPGAGFQKTALAWKTQGDTYTEETFQYVLKSVANGTAVPSVVSKALESKEAYKRHVIAKSAMQMVSGGADTTVSASETFILAMLLHPEVQKLAHEEIDRVVGTERLPTYADRPNLPYIEAIMKEALRWHPPVPVVPRTSTKDDVYEGYFLPEGSFIMINFWAMLHNDEAFPEPMSFKPERWLDVQLTKEIDPLGIAFGFGRRECPGKIMAIELVFTVFVNILAVFDIVKVRDANGEEITPPENYTNGSITAPLPFKADFKVRSTQALQVLQQDLEEVGR